MTTNRRVIAPIPALRLRALNTATVRGDGDVILYWMIAARRTRWNFGLQRALWWARELEKPLVVLEALRCDYRWASARLHAFVLQGMTDNAQRLARAGIAYHPYVEPSPGAGAGLLRALAARACVVVTDAFPCFFLPRMVAAAARHVPVALETVDSNGLVPLAATPREFTTAFSFRTFLHKELPAHWGTLPVAHPLAGWRGTPAVLPPAVTARWPAVPVAALGDASALAGVHVDRGVAPVGSRGGAVAGEARLRRFVARGLDRYEEVRNEPEEEGTSGLSPYLHFGHVSAHEVWHALAAREGWEVPERPRRPTGKRAGWWGMSPAAEAFLDQLVTWRELGYVFCHHRDDYDQFDSLPAWARATLRKHARDRRAHTYTLAQFEAAETHDPLWNAAQTQLRREGRLHNYLRMLWGKKILEWSPSAPAALAVMIELNNKYALDGRNPNSYSGIFWCLGRFDRAWGPERPVFGTVRFMSSENTARKVRVRGYLERYGPRAS